MSITSLIEFQFPLQEKIQRENDSDSQCELSSIVCGPANTARTLPGPLSLTSTTSSPLTIPPSPHSLPHTSPILSDGNFNFSSTPTHSPPLHPVVSESSISATRQHQSSTSYSPSPVMGRSDHYYHGSPQSVNGDFSKHASQKTYASEEIYQGKSEFEPSNEARPYGGKSPGVYQKKSDSRYQESINAVSSY